ncbi:aminopeptidase N [Diprion similis]|uniref:aminopeptidase N n=1 Tax=Diprion similis TaxID=362088 RepID=UPI001EF8C37C|nr:aminopeptidase N [Diprion similis]XP_046740954.1 aminopeptidase N [Diprion similis]
MGRTTVFFTVIAAFLFLGSVAAYLKQGDRQKRSVDLNEVYSMIGSYRLPKEIQPTSYRLELQPFIKEGKFKGRVKIHIVPTDKTDRITLNVHPDLQISHSDVRVTQLDSSPTKETRPSGTLTVNVARTERHTKRPWYIIHLEQILDVHDLYEVDITYSGNITTNATQGLFRNQYKDSSGQEHFFVATYLRPNHAQRMFPCFDEPAYKATFNLSVTRPRNYTARSNTPVEKTEDVSGEPDIVWDHFAQTPKISSYQLALVISDFESISPTTKVNEMNGNSLDIRIWSRKEYLETLKAVPDKVVKIINYLQDFFNSSILVPKLDIMAIPMYSASQPSDSWGLMFFKESELSSTGVWSTAYQITYQWIGQFATPFWWSDSLVNEALNSYLASMTTLEIYPDELDGKWPTTTLYSLYYEFGKRFPFSRINGIKQDATAAKTALVFRMFNYTLGNDLMQRSLRRFIQNQWREKSRTFFTDDIYTCLNDVANESQKLIPDLTLNNIAASWINRDRLPLVTVTRDYESGNITFSQEVYLRDRPQEPSERSKYTWYIPIVIVSQAHLDFSKTVPTVWMMKDADRSLTIKDVATNNSFVIVNPEEIGMFPVNYDSRNWEMLAKFLQGPEREKIPVLTRAKLLHDAWNIAYAGDLCFDIALNMTLFLKEERSHVVWEPVFPMIDHIGRRIENSCVHLKFEAFIRSLLKPVYARLGEMPQPGEPLWKTQLRGVTKNFLCKAGYEPCIKEAREQYKKWMANEEPDKGNPVAHEFICPVFKWGTDDEWDFGLKRVINFPLNSPERNKSERTYLLKTLAGCPKDASKIKKLLAETILGKNSDFTDADIHLIFSMLTGSATGYTTLFNFLSENWDEIKLKFQDKKHLWDGIVNSATLSFNTQDGYDMVSELYVSRQGEVETTDAIIEKALKNIKEETQWSEENLPVIERWLTANLSKEDLDAIAAASTATTTMAASHAG